MNLNTRSSTPVDRRILLHWLPPAAWAGILAVIGVQSSTGHAASDDVYITYRYAANLAAGHGLVYNLGERVFGVSDPGVAAVLAGLHLLLRVPIPAAGTLLTAVSLFAIALMTSAALRATGYRLAGILAGTLIVSSPFLWLGEGSGPLPSLALVLAATLVVGRRPIAAAMLAGAAVACRPDAVLAVAILCVLTWIRERPVLARFITALAASGIAVALFVWASFGTLIPNTLAAKRAFAGRTPAAMGGWHYLDSAWDLARYLYGPPWWILVLSGAFGLALCLRSGNQLLRLIATAGLVFGAFYALAGIPFFVWYACYPFIAILVGASLAFGWIWRRVGASGLPVPARRSLSAAVIAVGMFAAALLGQATLRWSRAIATPSWRFQAYTWAGTWIAAHSAPAEDIAFDEIGYLGYSSERPILDLIGLVSPSSVPFTAHGGLLGAFLQHPTEWIVQHTYDARGGTRPITSRPWFPAAYREAARWEDPSGAGGIFVYRRVNAKAIPPPGSAPP